MKFFKYLFICIISGISFSACVDEAIPDNNRQEWQQGEVPYYMTLKLKPSSDTFTRAGERSNQFENFEYEVQHNEHDISPKAGNVAIFFDENNKYISCADLYSINEKTEWEDGDINKDIPDTESTYKCRFYGFADSQPAKVLVIVNAPRKIYDQITDFPGWTLDEVMKQIWSEPGTTEENDPLDNLGFYVEGSGDSKTLYFTMTNSTYLTKNQDGSYTLNCAQIIPDGSITDDPTEIGNLTPVTVYLERIVSKFQLTTSFDVNKYIPTTAQALDVCKYDEGDFSYSAYKWGIQLLGWGLNGLETSNYLFKNLPYESDNLTESLKDLYDDGWNSEYNKRSYWSIDPHYKKEDRGALYPWQFDDAMDKYDSLHQLYYEHFQYYDDPGKSFALAYYPFQSFCPINDDGVLDATYEYKGNNLTLFSPENTFMPGLTVDRSRGSRAYELAGTHILLAARLLLPDENGTDYQPFSGNIYKNRVGISYTDEASLFKDFMNTVNYQLNSQRYLYYKYYDWDNSGVKAGYLGHTIRARSEGDYALYCYFPYNTKNTTIGNLINKAFGNNTSWTNGVIIELTHDLIDLLDTDKTHYQLYKDADAINADGKVIPWIMYRDDEKSPFKQVRLMILERQPDDVSEYDFIKNYNYGNSFNSGAEFIFGNPDDKSNNNSVGTYLSGTQGNKVGLSTWGTSVSFEDFKATDSQGGVSFSDDFSNNNTLNTNWKKENTATTGQGNWKVDNGQLQQTNTQMEGEILTFNQTFSRSYTIEVKAIVNDGREGFLVVFNYADENNYCWWNVGGWTNTSHALELVKDGQKSSYDFKSGKLTQGAQYYVKVVVNGANVKCYLNDELIHDVIMPFGRELKYETLENQDNTSDSYIGDDNDVQSIFYETWGMVDCFKNGLMYYAVPIYAQDRNGKPAIDNKASLEENANEDFIDDEKLRYYYGVIRNNWYKFTLHSINDIGIPVVDPTKPIVPNYDNKLNQNKVEMEILRWHVDDITVEIPKK